MWNIYIYIYIYIYICTHTLQIIYPLAHSIDYSTHLTKLLILKREWIIEKIPMSAAASMSG